MVHSIKHDIFRYELDAPIETYKHYSCSIDYDIYIYIIENLIQINYKQYRHPSELAACQLLEENPACIGVRVMEIVYCLGSNLFHSFIKRHSNRPSCIKCRIGQSSGSWRFLPR